MGSEYARRVNLKGRISERFIKKKLEEEGFTVVRGNKGEFPSISGWPDFRVDENTYIEVKTEWSGFTESQKERFQQLLDEGKQVFVGCVFLNDMNVSDYFFYPWQPDGCGRHKQTQSLSQFLKESKEVENLKQKHSCERCGRKINHRGRCLPCNILFKHKKHTHVLIENPEYDAKHGLEPKLARLLIENFKLKNKVKELLKRKGSA